jgi:DNA repair photolyase
MLGELYQPKGLARETAQAVLECKENVYAVNLSYGFCHNNCSYCYNKRNPYVPKERRYPKKPPVELVKKQLEKGLEVDGVFMSFGCDPLSNYNWENTYNLKNLLLWRGINVAILSKMERIVSVETGIRCGATIVSLENEFARMYEPRAPHPKNRLEKLKIAHKRGVFVWVSMEPYPAPEIFKQDLDKLLEELSFVDFIIFGKWNYDKRANTPEAKEFYKNAAAEFVDFCEEHKIRYHVKSDTLGGGK